LAEVETNSDSPSRRKLQLEQKINERKDAEQRERDRERKKVLQKEKRNIEQYLVQVRHTANDQQSKVKRGQQEIEKVDVELERLKRWREKEDERLKNLMQQLIEEQKELEEEFRCKFEEADEVRSTLIQEHEHLSQDLLAKCEEVKRVESSMEEIDDALKRLDDFAVDGVHRKRSDSAFTPQRSKSRSRTAESSPVSSRFGMEHTIGQESEALSPESSIMPVVLNNKGWTPQSSNPEGSMKPLSVPRVGAPATSSSGRSTVEPSSAKSRAQSGSDAGHSSGDNGLARINDLSKRAGTPMQVHQSTSLVNDGLPTPFPVSVQEPNDMQAVAGSGYASPPAGSGYASPHFVGPVNTSPLRILSPSRQISSPLPANVVAMRQVSRGDGTASPVLLGQRIPPAQYLQVRQAAAGTGKPTPIPMGQVSPSDVRLAHPPVNVANAMPVPSRGLFNWDL
jgi:hypothetical protein